MAINASLPHEAFPALGLRGEWIKHYGICQVQHIGQSSFDFRTKLL